jgi:glycosyltransferase involved in cell wall biosynthesis
MHVMNEAANGQSPLVSVVLPVYNGQRYLAESIQSCLDQTLTDWELLVVDDASTDETPAIIEKFVEADHRIHHLRHQTNRRLPAALNSGFAEARGTYLSWTSDDNHYRPEALSEMVKLLQANPSVDFVYTDFDIVDDAGVFVRTVSAPPPDRLIQGYDPVPCFLYARSLYAELGGYSEDLFLSEDYEYWLRILASRHTMYPLHLNLYEYRRHSRSLTDEHRGRTFAAAERALLGHLSDFDWAGASVRGEVYLHLASLASWQGHRRQAAKYAVSAIRSRPLALLAKTLTYTTKRARKWVQQLGMSTGG